METTKILNLYWLTQSGKSTLLNHLRMLGLFCQDDVCKLEDLNEWTQVFVSENKLEREDIVNFEMKLS